jgi:hypothetical protein
MPYALFEDKQKLSQDYPTYEEAWRHADEAGLTDVVGGTVVLADGYVIEPCAPDQSETSPTADVSPSR